MPYGYSTDPELDRSTNRIMAFGVALLVPLVLAFPLYLSFEPGSRDEAREENVASLAAEGETLWEFNCASCHGESGEGGSAPALNSQQFLQSATDDQIGLLIAVGVPGTAMSAFSQDFAGPLTSEQIKGLVTYLRLLEEDAPDVPNWRNPTPADTPAEAAPDAGADAEADLEAQDAAETEADDASELEFDQQLEEGGGDPGP
jgi:mono/diheme cytochrome c family protein